MIRAWLAAVVLPMAPPVFAQDFGHPAATALDDDCAHAGLRPDRSVSFLFTCPQTSRSPDGQWSLETTRPVGEDEFYRVIVRDAAGREVGDVPGLADGMPFVLMWSSRSGWFAVSHHVGSFMDQPQLFHVTRSRVVRIDDFLLAGQAQAVRLNPCLGGTTADRAWASGELIRWSRDGRKLAWIFQTRLDMCWFDKEGPIPKSAQWRPFLMISDAATGAIVHGSVRVLPDDPATPFRLPTVGPYRHF